VTREKRCDARSKYNVNLLIANLGDERYCQSFSFHKCYTKGGADLLRFFDFMLDLCDWLATNHPGHQFLITIDNLNIHKHPMIIHLIYFRGHRVVFHAPYWYCAGSIEYVVHTLQTRLSLVVMTNLHLSAKLIKSLD
jgi:hypothetical protein